MADNEADHHPYTNLQRTIRDVYKRFQDFYSELTCEVMLHEDGLYFLGVHTGLKDSLPPIEIRDAIAKMLNIRADYSIVQVVGDSGSAYTPAARAMLKLQIMSAVNTINLRRRYAVVEYGYTAGLHDMNWVVNDVFELMRGLTPLTIGNLVFESAKAIEEWGCEASGDVRFFVMAYNAGETKFGDDMWISDEIMMADRRDTMICCEGGPQAFYQAATVAAKMVTVVAIYGGGLKLRQDDVHADPATVKPKFSAAFVLGQLKDRYDELNLTGELRPGYREELRVALESHLEGLAAHGKPVTDSQRTLIFRGFDKLLDSPDCFRAIVGRRVDP